MTAVQFSVSDRRVLTWLWVMLGATMSLSAVDFFRLNVRLPGNPLQSYNIVYDDPVYGSAHLSWPMLLVTVIIGWTGAMILARRGRIALEGDGHLTRTAAKLTAALLLWHVGAALWSPNKTVWFRETSKVAIGCLIFALILGLVPRRSGVVERFWTAAVWGGAILCGWLMYRSARYYTGDFLNLELDENSNFGRNQFAGTLAYLIPFAAAYAWAYRRQVWRYIPFATLGFALLYSASRGGTISAVLGLLIITASRVRGLGWFRRIRRLAIGTVVLAAVVAGAVAVTGYDTTAISRRWLYLYDPESVPELHSYDNRELRVMLTLGIAMRRPITGWGIGQLLEEDLMGSLPHNDYLTMLAELGIVGLILLLTVFGFVAWRLFRRPRGDTELSWTHLGSRGAFVALTVFMVTIDRVYSTTAFWIVLAMMLVATDSETPVDGPQAICEAAAR